jgi:hypothetical protein
MASASSERCTRGDFAEALPAVAVLVVVRDFDFVGIALLPPETDSELIVDLN